MSAGQFLVVVMLAAASQAYAHVDKPASVAPWNYWPLAPDVLIGAVLAAGFYLSGMRRRSGRDAPASGWRHASFFGGLAVILAAVQSPLDSLAQHSFVMHQVQHLLLYALGPLLIMAAAPQALLVSGMPEGLRRTVLTPLMRSRLLRLLLGGIAQPAMATLLFVGSMYFWQIPGLHDLTLLDAPLHYLMHSTMLFAGLVFFWRVLDPRPRPLGAGYGTRVVMVTAAISGTLPLGAYLALKSPVLYPSYDWFGRLWNLDALVDEGLGGLVIWIPGGVICALAILITLRMWGAQEAKSDEWRRRGLAAGAPEGDAQILQSNRRMASRLFAFSLTAFATLLALMYIGMAILSGDSSQ